MLTNHPLRQIIMMEAGIEKTVASFRRNDRKRKQTAEFNRNSRETFSFILDAEIDFPELIPSRSMEVVYSHLYVTYVNKLCRFAEENHGHLIWQIAHYHDVCNSFSVFKRQDRQRIAQELSDITEAVVAMDVDRARSLS